MTDTRKIWQPVLPSVRPKLDPEYVAFHDEFLQYVELDEIKSWDPAIRALQRLPYTGYGPAKVGSTEDVQLDTCVIRVFSPEGDHGGKGWPLFVYFHGGGLAQGGINSDVDYLTRLCAGARCVVATVGYRLAPEHPYPACLLDAETAIRWLVAPDGGRDRFAIDVSRVAIGGTSSGGLVSLVAAMKCAAAEEGKEGVAFVFQLLVCPVVDNTTTADSPHWRVVGAASPSLTPPRMIWYRKLWLPEWTPESAAALDWDASPSLAPAEAVARLPPTWLAIPEFDLLSAEGLAFAERMRQEGVSVTTKVYPGCPHDLIELPGVMEQSRQLHRDAVEALRKAVWPEKAN